jgi:transposase InsO family protein
VLRQCGNAGHAVPATGALPHKHRQLLNEHGVICSMSKKGDCYDNAAMESWNHSLKVEAIHGERFGTRAQAKAQVFDYIVGPRYQT